MTVIGVDPGLTGAIACYDKATDTMTVIDMPKWTQVVGKRKRNRIDAVAVSEYFGLAKLSGAELVVMEAVGGRPRQSAASGFVFGYVVGLLYMAIITARIPIETVVPQHWKKLMRVPGKVTGNEHHIVARADEMMPNHTALWRGPKDGYKVDRAEACMLAKYGADYLMRDIVKVSDVYKVDTGA